MVSLIGQAHTQKDHWKVGCVAKNKEYAVMENIQKIYNKKCKFS